MILKLEVTPVAMRVLKRSWRYVLWRSCRHARASARVYRGLAERQPDESRRAMLLRLAAHAERRADLKANHLRKFSADSPDNRDRLTSRVWRWVLVRCGIKAALAWLSGIERGDVLLSLAVVRLTTRVLHRDPRFRGEWT